MVIEPGLYPLQQTVGPLRGSVEGIAYGIENGFGIALEFLGELRVLSNQRLALIAQIVFGIARVASDDPVESSERVRAVSEVAGNPSEQVPVEPLKFPQACF